VSDGASRVRDALPCLSDSCDFDPENIEYVKGLIFWMIPGILVALITPIAFCSVCCCRKCGKCGGGQSDKTFTTKEKWRLYAICMVFLFTNAVFACVGLAANAAVSDALLGAKGELYG
jgi:hypothetical protein